MPSKIRKIKPRRPEFTFWDNLEYYGSWFFVGLLVVWAMVKC